MKVVLRPMRQDSWSGIIKYKNCYEDIGTYLTRSGTRYTGLTPEDAKRLGEKLGYDLGQSSDFWKTFYIRTTNRDVILETEDAFDELKYLFLTSHKRVKNSLFENKATANFVLVNQDEEAKKDNMFGKVKRQAIREFDKMSMDEMRKCLRLYGKSAEEVSSEIVENRLFDLVEGDPQGFINKWVNNTSRETQYIIERAISMNIIRKNKRIYNYGTDTIGHGLEDAVNYLLDPQNQDVKIAIIQQIEGKGALNTANKDDMLKVRNTKIKKDNTPKSVD